MTQIASFHEVSFPRRLAFGAAGGPRRATEIVTLGSGHEQRNARWSQSRRRYDASQGVRTLDDLYELLSFFEARKGRLYGFRFRDPFDWKSCPPGAVPSSLDQTIGVGDGVAAIFALTKTYGGLDTLARRIAKPVTGSVRLAVAGTELADGVDFTVDSVTGTVEFAPAAVPVSGAVVTAGFEFEVPVRFDADEIVASLSAFEAGEIAAVPLLEILP
jgi:uncharacterized protein (TIGR02217 family)